MQGVLIENTFCSKCLYKVRPEYIKELAGVDHESNEFQQICHRLSVMEGIPIFKPDYGGINDADEDTFP